MSLFQYTAKDKNGRTVSGAIEAAQETAAAELLHAKDLTVLTLKLVKGRAAVSHRGKKVKLDDLVIFSRQLATMIESGIPLVQALNILGEQNENQDFKGVILIIQKDIESGIGFCDALAKHPQIFSDLFINMVRAGEASGMLDEILDRLAAYQEKAASLSRKVNSSLVYPAAVVIIAVLITGFLMIKVVPTFKSIFDMLGGTLPLPTRILIMVSDILKNYILYVVGFFVAAVFLLKKYINTERGRYNFDRLKLTLPLLGPLFCKVAIAKFSRTFSTLVKSGVSVLNALDIVARTSGNKVIEEAVINAKAAVREGEPISRPLSKSGVFPPMVCRMIGVGEQTGQLEKMLGKISDFYDEQVDAAVTGLTSMIEPIVILLLGIVVGGIVVSLFLPIFKITELVSK